MNYLTQGGVAAIIIYLVLKEVFPFVLKMKNGNGYSNGRSDKADLVEYGRLMEKVKGNTDSIADLTRIVTKTAENVHTLTGAVSTLTEMMKKPGS